MTWNTRKGNSDTLAVDNFRRGRMGINRIRASSPNFPDTLGEAAFSRSNGGRILRPYSFAGLVSSNIWQSASLLANHPKSI